MNGVGAHGKIRKELKPVNDSFNNLSSIIRYREAGIDISLVTGEISEDAPCLV